MPKIAIIGGGVAGLTVAHECVERGCDVFLFEKETLVGGKGATDYYRKKPRDHAPKNISPYYYCLIEQLKRIPTSDHKTVYDNLTPITNTTLRWRNTSISVTSSTQLIKKIQRAFKIYRFLRAFISLKDIFKFLKHLKHFFFCSNTKRKQFDQISYLNLLQLDINHPIIKLSESTAAIDPNASALMCLDQFFRQILTVFNPYHLKFMTHFFSMPASDSFFTPWKSHLQKLGVKIATDCEITEIKTHENKITGFHSGSEFFDGFDAYVIATDISGLQSLAASSHLKLNFIPDQSYQKKACGFFIALNALPSHLKNNHYYISLDHPWSMFYLCLTQDEFKNDIYFPDDCKAYIWLALSHVENKGIYIKKTLEQTNKHEVLNEIMHYLEFTEEDKNKVVDYFWGRSVTSKNEDLTHSVDHPVDATKMDDDILNEMPTIFNQPVNPTAIPNNTTYHNLFLAGEFTDTLQKSPTMEKANESGKRCSQLILNSFNIEYPSNKFEYQYLPFQKK